MTLQPLAINKKLPKIFQLMRYHIRHGTKLNVTILRLIHILLWQVTDMNETSTNVISV